MRKTLSFVLLAVAVCACAQTLMAFQGAAGRTSQPTEGGSKGTGRVKTPRTNVPPPPPPPRPTARLTVRVNMPGSVVEFDGKEIGSIDGSGYVNLPTVFAGQHILVVRKSGYYESRQVVELASGSNGPLEITLLPRPGHLSVHPNPSGAHISIAGVGSYSGSADDVELAPGDYSLSVTRLGYAPFVQDVTIAPGMSRNLTLTLNRLPASALLSLAESEFQAGRYAQAVALGEMALPDMPSHPRLTMLLGLAHFRLNNLQISLDYLQQAVMLGQTLSLNVKHFHKLKKGEGFCQGQLVLRRGALEFRSGENPSESFNVPFSKVLGLRPDSDKGWRVSMQIVLPDPKTKNKNKKEKGFDYSFHPVQAYLINKDPRKRNSSMLAACSDCQPMAQFIYQLVQQAGR